MQLSCLLVFFVCFICLFVLFIFIFFRDLQKSIANQPPEQTPQAPPHHQAFGTVSIDIIENTTGCPYLVVLLVNFIIFAQAKRRSRNIMDELWQRRVLLCLGKSAVSDF